jgi:hypothetical protein
VRFFVLLLVAVFVALVVIAGVITPRHARAATIATDTPATTNATATTIATDTPATTNATATTIATDTPATTNATATTIATDTSTTTNATATTIATDATWVTSREADPPREVMLGRFLYEPYMVTSPGGRNLGGRFGVDMIAATGDGATKLGGGIRFTLGGDGAGAFGTEGQLLLGVVRTISDRAAVSLVAPLGFSLGGGGDDFAPHGYVGLEGIAAVGRFARERGPGVRGVELAAGISNRGARARVGLVRPGKDVGWGLGVDWQRDGSYDLLGVYFATTAGR